MRVEHDVFLIAEKEFTHSHQVERTIVWKLHRRTQFVDSMCMTLKHEKPFGERVFIIIIILLYSTALNACAITRISQAD